jgi:hypothetical protein
MAGVASAVPTMTASAPSTRAAANFFILVLLGDPSQSPLFQLIQVLAGRRPDIG